MIYFSGSTFGKKKCGLCDPVNLALIQIVESFKDDYKLQKYQQGFIKCSKSINQSSIGTKKDEKLV